jgi:hypothetical protein
MRVRVNFGARNIRFNFSVNFIKLAAGSLNLPREKRERFSRVAITATAGFPFAGNDSIIAGSEAKKLHSWPNYFLDSIPAHKA